LEETKIKTMDNTLIQFAKLQWETPAEGVEQKVYSNGNQRMRLIRFYDNFVEKDWCLKGHIGYVTNGEMKISFDGIIKSFRQGDGLWIDEGEEFKHKVIMEKGKQVEIILFEDER